MKDACTIGMGTVGKATAAVFGIDQYFSRHENTITLEEAAKCRYIFLCLPTPAKENGYDLSAINEVVRQLAEYKCSGLLINRSTVLPGTAKKLMEDYGIPVVSNPEFLSEDTALEDERHPAIIVIGSENPSRSRAVQGLYEARFKGINTFLTDTVTAEMVKCAMNAFFVTKVVFANQIFDLCQRIGANYETVKGALYSHPYGSKNHFDIFHKGGRGAGGRCLKKDVQAFSYFAESELLDVVQKINTQLLTDHPKHI